MAVAPICLAIVAGLMVGLAVGRHTARPAAAFTPMQMMYWVWPETILQKTR